MIKYVLNKFGTLSLFGEFVRLCIRGVEEGGSLDESLVDDSTITPCFFGSNIECHFCQWIGLFDQILDKFDCIALLLDTPCAKLVIN